MSNKIKCYVVNGEFVNDEYDSFDNIIKKIKKEILYNIPIDAILGILNKFGKELTRDKKMISQPGVLYLAQWLRKSNLEQIIKVSIFDKKYLDIYLKNNGKAYLRAQSRGVVCHWVAGNIPTLALFSLIQSIICKNVNIARVPLLSITPVLNILKVLQRIRVNHNNMAYSGASMLKSISLIHFPSDDIRLNEQFSLNADCRVIWGGSEAIKSILALPQKEHCESIVFGPKYSFSVIDEDSANRESANSLVKDTILFGQNACSSPHIIFIETKSENKEASMITVKKFAQKLAMAFNEYDRKFSVEITEINSRVINVRGAYLLDINKDIICSEDLKWTILCDNEVKLEEPVKSNTLYIKPVDCVYKIIPLITHKIQTIGIALSNSEKKMKFCEMSTAKGVSRCVKIGTMHNYENPWDGILFMNRLVRWTIMRC